MTIYLLETVMLLFNQPIGLRLGSLENPSDRNNPSGFHQFQQFFRYRLMSLEYLLDPDEV